MPTLSQHRLTLGAEYAAALDTFKTAYVRLAAADRLLHDTDGKASFGPPPDTIPLQHAQFAPRVVGNWGNEITAAIHALNRQFPAPVAA
jgi:hypothetical protein